MRKTPVKILAGVAGLGLVLSACGGDDGDGITIGTKIDQPGTGILISGEYSGLDVDVAREIASRLGYEVDDIEWLEAPTPQREDLLVAETVDFIAATYSITDARKERVQFAGPYFIAGQDLLIRADDDTISGPDDLDGKSLCSVTGSTPAERIADEYADLDIDLAEYDTYSLCMEALAAGRVDAITTDDVILAGYAAEDEWAGQFVVTGNTFSTEEYGIGLNISDERCGEINDIIDAMWEDGTMEQIIENNLGPANYTASAANPPTAGGNCA